MSSQTQQFYENNSHDLIERYEILKTFSSSDVIIAASVISIVYII
jgi:hypothetical protein